MEDETDVPGWVGLVVTCRYCRAAFHLDAAFDVTLLGGFHRSAKKSVGVICPRCGTRLIARFYESPTRRKSMRKQNVQGN